MEWADEFRGKFGVRANADIPRDAKVARAFGAEGIGLCRTEHMFFAEDRLPLMQAMILARDEKYRRKALQKLLPMQRSDFAGLFKAMDGFPVVIRTLDPPLHEFLPKREEPDGRSGETAARRYQDQEGNGGGYKIPVGELKKKLPELLQRVEELHEFNPMLGHRGCRLGIAYPEITEMQARAIFEAVVQVAKKGVKVIPEVMIPLIGSVEEFDNQKAIVVKVADEVLGKAGMKDQHYLVGTMIEIPRAALTADKVAKSAEFFSFGTNDLTQTTMGLSRDDYTKFQKIVRRRTRSSRPIRLPCWTRKASGFWSRWRPRTARRRGQTWKSESAASTVVSRVRSDSATGGDGLVSCSPYRVPIARLAAAQAAIADDRAQPARRRKWFWVVQAASRKGGRFFYWGGISIVKDLWPPRQGSRPAGSLRRRRVPAMPDSTFIMRSAKFGGVCLQHAARLRDVVSKRCESNRKSIGTRGNPSVTLSALIAGKFGHFPRTRTSEQVGCRCSRLVPRPRQNGASTIENSGPRQCERLAGTL